MIRFLQTPGPIKKVILSGILLVFCGAMVITLIPGGLGLERGNRPPAGVVARVGEQDITREEVMRAANNMLRQEFRGSGNMSKYMPLIAPQAAENLIQQTALVVEAERMGLGANDDDVRDEIQHGLYANTFFPGGKFVGEEAYANILESNGLTIPQFEALVKQDVLRIKLRNLITASASVTDAAVRQEFEKQNTKVKFEYAFFSEAELRKTIHPTESELKAFYNSNKTSYTNSIPEKRKVRYVVLDTAKISAETHVSEQDLESYYRDHREEFRVPEEVNVRHILIKTPAGPDGKVDPKIDQQARSKAEDVLKQVKAGGDFAELAKKFSEDAGSAKNGGSLGWIGRKVSVAEFEKVAFSLPKGSTSELVKSSFGYHIIHVDDKHEARVKSLDEVKAQIEPTIEQQKVSRQAESKSNAFLGQARANGLDQAASAQGLQATTTDFFGRNDSLAGIGNSPAFMDAVFGAGEKSPPDMVETKDAYAVFQLLEVRPPATPSFEEIRSRVEQEFINQQASSLLNQKTQELSDRTKAEHDLKKATKELGASLKTSDFVLPTDQVPDIGSMRGPAATAFSMKPGDTSGPIVNATSGAVLQVVDKRAPSEEEFAQKKDQIRDSLLQQKQGDLFNLFVSNLVVQMDKSGKIKRNQEELKQLGRGATDQGY